MDDSALGRLLIHQNHVLTRGQVIAHGGDDNDIARKVRRREWAPKFPGVYVAHTGPLTRDQLEWAAILYYAPAALTGPSALRRYGVRLGRDREPTDGGEVVHIAVERGRRVDPSAGVTVTRLKRFDEDILDNFSPPRLRLEQAVLDTASAKDESGAVAIICDAVQSRRTTPERLLGALAVRPRLRHRSMLRRILSDVVVGAYSVLEREYLNRVERRHGLPAGSRQRRVHHGRSPAYRDVEYPTTNTVVELDGRLGHELVLDRWDDLERDVESAVDGALTLRLGWGQVLQPCRVAVGVARILLARGWAGQPRECSPSCPVTAIRGVQPA